MIQFRWTYDFEYGDEAEKHPVIEVLKYKLEPSDLLEIYNEINSMIKPEIIDKVEIRIKKK